MRAPDAGSELSCSVEDAIPVLEPSTLRVSFVCSHWEVSYELVAGARNCFLTNQPPALKRSGRVNDDCIGRSQTSCINESREASMCQITSRSIQNPEFKRNPPIPRSVRSSLPTVDRCAREIVRRSCWVSLASRTVHCWGQLTTQYWLTIRLGSTNVIKSFLKPMNPRKHDDSMDKYWRGHEG